MTKPREVELKVGRRSVDGVVRISPHPPQLVQLSVSYKGERAASVVLTRAQVRAVREALAEFESNMADDHVTPERWNSDDRRRGTVFQEKLTA
jgi:hypothetical protein